MRVLNPAYMCAFSICSSGLLWPANFAQSLSQGEVLGSLGPKNTLAFALLLTLELLLSQGARIQGFSGECRLTVTIDEVYTCRKLQIRIFIVVTAGV